MSDIYYDSDVEENTTPKFSDSPEFEKLKDEISALLFEINGQLGTLQQFISSLNGFLENNNVNVKAVDRLDKKSIDNIHKIKDLVNVVNSKVQEIDSFEETTLDKTQIIAREKLVRDVRNSVQEFQNTQQKYTRVIKLINDKAKLQLNENTAALTQEQEQENTPKNKNGNLNRMVVERDPINNEEFAYQQNLIEQRDEEIANIEQGIHELNEIFQDLGTVVQQQGVLVDNIEANLYSTADNTNMASTELRRAMRSQRFSNRCSSYLLIVLTAFLLLLILINLV